MGPHPDPDLFDECRVLQVGGELDVTTAPAFTRDLEDARHGTGPLYLIVDLREATFMDGSVLAPLCAAWDDCHERHGWARVVYTRPGIGLLFRAGAVQERFPRYATARDARRGVTADPREQYIPARDLSA